MEFLNNSMGPFFLPLPIKEFLLFLISGRI